MTILVCSFTGCSEENNINTGSSSKIELTINVTGITSSNEENVQPAVAKSETVNVPLGDGLNMKCTLAANAESLTRSTSPMLTGVKYRLIAYNASTNAFVKEKLFTAGTQDKLELEVGYQYKLVAISYNTNTDPGPIGNNADITVDPSIDLLHWVCPTIIDATNYGSENISITFKHRFTKIKIAANASYTGNNIVSIPTATITPGYQGKLTLLNDNAPVANGTASTQTFSWNSSGSQILTSNERYIFTDNASSSTVNISNLTVTSPIGNKAISTPVVFTKVLLSGYSYTLSVNIEASKGDYYPYASATGGLYETSVPLGTAYNGNTSLIFLRYNLSADPSLSIKEQMAYPHTDIKNIRVYGGLWQWGRNDIYHALRDSKDETPDMFTTTQYTTTTYNQTPQKFVYGSGITTWFSGDTGNSSNWGNGSGIAGQTASISAGTYNPCPTGFRVPTQHEWALIGNEDASSSSYGNDYFNTTSNTNIYSSGNNRWYIPSSNHNVVWVRVSGGYASDSFVNGKLNGWTLYNSSEWSSTDEKFKNGTTALTGSAAPNPVLFLPAGGLRFRDSATIQYTGVDGYYWSSVIYTEQPTSSFYLSVSSTNIDVKIAGYRAGGMSIRCVKQ